MLAVAPGAVAPGAKVWVFCIHSSCFDSYQQQKLKENQGLFSKGHESCFLSNAAATGMQSNSGFRQSQKLKIAIALLITSIIALAIFGAFAVFRARKMLVDYNDSEMGGEIGRAHV